MSDAGGAQQDRPDPFSLSFWDDDDVNSQWVGQRLCQTNTTKHYGTRTHHTSLYKFVRRWLEDLDLVQGIEERRRLVEAWLSKTEGWTAGTWQSRMEQKLTTLNAELKKKAIDHISAELVHRYVTQLKPSSSSPRPPLQCSTTISGKPADPPSSDCLTYDQLLARYGLGETSTMEQEDEVAQAFLAQFLALEPPIHPSAFVEETPWQGPDARWFGERVDLPEGSSGPSQLAGISELNLGEGFGVSSSSSSGALHRDQGLPADPVYGTTLTREQRRRITDRVFDWIDYCMAAENTRREAVNKHWPCSWRTTVPPLVMGKPGATWKSLQLSRQEEIIRGAKAGASLSNFLEACKVVQRKRSGALTTRDLVTIFSIIGTSESRPSGPAIEMRRIETEHELELVLDEPLVSYLIVPTSIASSRLYAYRRTVQTSVDIARDQALFGSVLVGSGSLRLGGNTIQLVQDQQLFVPPNIDIRVQSDPAGVVRWTWMHPCIIQTAIRVFNKSTGARRKLKLDQGVRTEFLDTLTDWIQRPLPSPIKADIKVCIFAYKPAGSDKSTHSERKAKVKEACET